MGRKKTTFSEQEALEFVFNEWESTPEQHLLQDKVNTYRGRWKKGKLSQKSIDNILKEVGFELGKKIWKFKK